MKKLISSVLIFSLMLTLFASAMPDDRNNSAIMNEEQMAQVVGSENIIYCIGGALVGAVGLVGAIVGTVGVGVIIGVYTISTALSIACGSGGGSDNRDDYNPSHRRFERVN